MVDRPWVNIETGQQLSHLEYLRQLPTGPYTDKELQEVLQQTKWAFEEYTGDYADKNMGSEQAATAYWCWKLLRLHRTLESKWNNTNTVSAT